MHRARHPVLSGSRGPWTLADGWSPFNPTGVVRNRLVRRTGDTPPHRLAVGLARRVLEEARDIRSDAGIHLDGNGADLDAIRAAAENVLVSPSFSEVPVHAEVHLDSPSLQMNARCRPLLQAWDTLQQGLGRRLDGAFEHAMSKPLARANLLYEHWCFVTLCERVSAHVGAKLPHPLIRSLSSWVQLEEDPNGRGRILEWITDQGETTWKVYHSCDGGVDIFDDGDGSHLGEPRKEGSLCSWSPASNPDGIFVLEREGECPVLHAWDAKYRNLSKNRFKSGYLYQAHAYRDALTYCDAQCSWSIVLHPHHEACGDLELWKSTDSRHPGGVALFPLPPRLLHRSGDDVNKKNEETREKIAEVFRLLEEHTARRCE